MDVQDNHRKDNQSIKDVQAPLMHLRIPSPPQREINHPVNRPDQNAKTCNIRNPQNRLPVPLQLMIRAINGTVFLIDIREALFKAGSETLGGEVEADGDNTKETEAGELDSDADLRDLLASVGLGDGVLLARRDGRDLDGTPELEQERKDIAGDENGSYESWWDPEESCCACLLWDNVEDDATEDDVACCGHQDRCQNNQGEVDNVEVLVIDALD